jgi:nondiscriminating aspartyl-tRNA synthetase
MTTGAIELEATDITILAKSETLPFDIGKDDLNLNLETLLDYRSFTLRHPKIRAIFLVQETIIQSFRKTMKEAGATEIQTPTIVPTTTEGGANVFPVKYYDYNAYLGQSPQLYKQIMVSVFERVFTVAHAYRAEPSITTRHLSEYIGLDAEIGFITDYNEIMDIVEIVMKNIFKDLDSERKKELSVFNVTTPEVKDKIPRLKLREVQEIIYKRTGRDHRAEPDLDPEDEREVCRYTKEKFGSDLVFVTHYPSKKRPFYTYPDPQNPEYTLSFDLLGRGVEWVTGGQRINDYPQLVENTKKWGNDPKDFEMYLMAFRYGMPKEGGFCIGLERVTQLILGLGNVREASLFPRDMERVDIRLSSIKKKPQINEDEFFKLKAFLDKNKVNYKVFDHQPVFTSEEAALARGAGGSLKEGAKAIVFMADKKPIMVVVSGEKKIDIKKFKSLYQIHDLRLATPEEVVSWTGLKPGAVHPYGNIYNLPLYVDKSLSNNEEIVFNAGLHTRSIRMKYSDYESLTHPIMGSFSK